MKKCYKCKKVKRLKDFQIYKSGKNKGHYHSYCKVCHKTYIKKRVIEFPWVGTKENIKKRCHSRIHHYFKKGIKQSITIKELEYLWHRDNAKAMKKPSIDRIDSTKDYTLENCRYIELSENIERGE